MKIKSPDSSYTGDSRYGETVLQFKDGVADHDGELPDSIRQYMQTAGYRIDTDPEPSEAPAKNASKADWHTYALAQGYTPESLDGRTRDEIRALINEE